MKHGHRKISYVIVLLGMLSTAVGSAQVTTHTVTVSGGDMTLSFTDILLEWWIVIVPGVVLALIGVARLVRWLRVRKGQG